ncbi:MAG: diaminopimelate epimerase, partial [Bacteroidales bacterium]|nr:diaminopimelate epimerase [Bacteroidales bacterium]
FVEILKTGDLWVRTYERGVEDETFACGTGVTASALAFALEKGENETHHDIKIHTRGGDLRVAFDRMAGEGVSRRFGHITLTGPACKVFEGVYRG